MVQAGEGLRLLAEPGQHARRPGDFGMEDLAGQAPIQVLVPELVHLGKAAAADETLDLVLRAQGPGEAIGSGDGRGGRGGRGSGDSDSALVGDHRGRGRAARRAERGAARYLTPARRTREQGCHGTKDLYSRPAVQVILVRCSHSGSPSASGSPTPYSRSSPGSSRNALPFPRRELLCPIPNGSGS